jgi:hypothetical protein
VVIKSATWPGDSTIMPPPLHSVYATEG